MTLYDKIYEIAADNHGLVTTAEANEAGAANKDLVRYVEDGRLTRIGRGVYRIKHHVPEPNDPYAEAVALVGPHAYLYGESVIAMHGLAPTNPTRILVGSDKRIRKHLPVGIKVVNVGHPEPCVSYDGIPSQSIPDAVRSCRRTMMRERLLQAVARARELGLITKREFNELNAELEKNEQAAQ